MKKWLLITSLFIISASLSGQFIKGIIIDATDSIPLQYASIGINNTSIGSITNELGEFSLETKKSTLKATVAFSMLGYESKTFHIQELTHKFNTIKLERKSFNIEEVIITPNIKSSEIGTTSFSLGGGVCGWGGVKFGQGHEIGIKLNLGEKFVKPISLSFRIHKQSFDSTMLRLHIRDIKNDQPNNELIDTNILFTATKSSGWIDVPLDKYDIYLKNEVVLSLEWVKVWGLNEKKMVKMHREKEKSAVFLLSTKNKCGETYIKRGVAANWKNSKNSSPSIFITVR